MTWRLVSDLLGRILPIARPAGNQPQSDQYFRHVVAGVRDYAIFLLDERGRILTWNAGAERLKGYAANEIIGQHFSRFYPDEMRSSGWPAQELEQAALTGRFEDEGWRIRKDGSRFWANVVISALRDDEGRLSGYLKVTRDLTERKHAEEDARRLAREEAARETAEAALADVQRAHREESRQRQQLEITLGSIGDGVIVTDATGAVTFLNPSAQAMTGWELDAAAGRPLESVFRIVNEETRATVANPVDKVLREGVIIGLVNHTVLIARDGTELSIDDSAAPIRAEDGRVMGMVLVFRDVTQSRRATEARLRLAAIVESSDDAIIGQNPDGVITSWNSGAERLYGYTADEVVGRPLTVLVPSDHPDEVPGLMARIRRGERIEHFESVRVRKDGTRLDVSLTISPIRDAAGRVVGASKIARDITARKRSEASMRFLAAASEALAEQGDVPGTLAKVAALAVPGFADWCAIDRLCPDGTLDRVAVAHVDPEKAHMVHELHRRYPPDRDHPHGVWNVIRTGRPDLLPDIPEIPPGVRAEEFVRVLRELGLRSYIGVPLCVRGKTLGAMTFVMAESGRRLGEADLHFAEDIAHRTAIAIENARLYGELKDAERRKDEFLAMLAHELRNPLAPIRNALHVIRMPGVDPSIVDHAHEITERQIAHLVRLVDDLLDVSRMMHGRIELRRAPVELAHVVTRGIETAQPVLDGCGQRLMVSVPEGPVIADVDATRLTQVVANLLHNAAKFSPAGARIWITLARDGSDAVLTVRDEGAGIRPELLPHVFDLFVQDDRSLERTRGGLGIGLTIIRQLVELHGGTVAAHSRGPGEGSEFTIRMPLGAGATASLAGVDGVDVPAAAARRILVVDDNVDAAESTALLLRLFGHDVRMAHDGTEALTLAEVYRPDVVLLDIGLPGLNGFEVAKRLRQQPTGDGALLVAVTGYGQDDDRRRSREAGFDHHLTKPVEVAALHALLETPHAPRTG